MPKNIEQGPRPEDVYKKLLEKRGLERHRERKGFIAKEINEEELEEEKEKIEQQVQKRLNLLHGKKEVPAAKIEKVGQKKEKGRERELLERQILSIEEEIQRIAFPREIEEITKESRKRLRRYLAERRIYLQGIEKLEKKIEEIEESIKEEEKKGEKASKDVIDELYSWKRKYNDSVEGYLETMENELPYRNPESFLAYSLLKIREYEKQLPSGIVETEYVKNQKERIKNSLATQRLAALMGETGTGKTLLARKLAQELTGDYEFIPGHKFTTKEDLLYYYGINAEKIKPEEIPSKIKEAIEKFKEEHSDLPEEEREKALEDVREGVKGQAQTAQMITEFFRAGVLKAAEEGKIVVIDEFNYIPPSVLGSINALIEAKPGQKISVGGQKIEIKPGFGVILTGNITQAEVKERYLGREKIEAALINRLNSGFIEYGFLPQAQIAFGESVLSEEVLKEGKEIPKRELFQVALATLADEKGNVKGPDDLLEKVWNLSCEFSLLQKLYAGEKLETRVKLEKDEDVVLKEYPISNRTFRSVLEHWKKDDYKYPIDYYIYENLIRPASGISSSEAGRIFLLLKERGMFFQDKAWGVLRADPMRQYKIEGIEEIERAKKEFLKSLESEKTIHYFLPQQVAEVFLGRKIPPLKESELVKKELKDKERMEKYQELKEREEKLKEFFENWDETIELYCKDEKKITSER